MEIWDLYTAERTLTGKTHVRGEELPDDLYHLVVHVWLRNSRGEYLISQRSANRPTLPLMWETVGGSVLSGENSFDGALREVHEEIGVDLSGCVGKTVFTKVRKVIDNKKYNDIVDVWLFKYDGDADLAKADTDEVCAVKWMTCDEIRRLYDDKEFAGSLGYFFDVIKDCEI